MSCVVITGGSRGIGAACVRAFSKKGDRVFFIYEKNDPAAKKIADETGAVPIRADISLYKEAVRAADEIRSLSGGIDILINNAGISQIKLFSDITEEDWDRMFNVNVKSAYFMTKLFLADMIHKKCGKIINISSIWGETGGSCEVHYSASKAALCGFTKALSKELAPSGICVNCIAPGVIETDMCRDFDRDTKAALCEEIPLMRLGSASDVANTVVFLASDSADYITGQVIGVNGGMYI